MLTDPAFLAVAILAVVLIGVSKSGFGGAMGSLSVPLMSLCIAAPQAAAIMLPILLVLDIIGLVVFRGKSDRANLRILIPGGLIGIALGAFTFHFVDARWIKGMVGVEALLFGVDRLRQISVASGECRAPDVAKGLFWGGVSGFTSFISHAGGPPVLQYLLPQGLDRVRMVGTTTLYFAAINFAKLLPYGVLGLLDTTNVAISLALLPAAPVGYWLGLQSLKHLPRAPFNLVVAVAMLLTGLKLLADAWSG